MKIGAPVTAADLRAELDEFEERFGVPSERMEDAFRDTEPDEFHRWAQVYESWCIARRPIYDDTIEGIQREMRRQEQRLAQLTTQPEPEWKDPPQERAQLGHRVWAARLAPLTRQPGRWAVWHLDKLSTAHTISHRIRHNVISGLVPGTWEATSRATEDGGGDVYVRYMGPFDRSATVGQ